MDLLYLWIGYLIILLLSFVYFYKFPHLVPKCHISDSIVMANGLASAVSLILFVWLLPEILRVSPLYPETVTLINFLLVIFYGVHLGRNMKPATPVPTKKEGI
ncbi:MAG: hypothetical protein ACYCSO_07255 [Cuniculiplasma sp.]